MSLDCSIRIRRTAPMFRVAVFLETCTKALYLVLGVAFTILGIASVIVPIVPAIATLLASSFFLSRSVPNVQYWLHDRPLIGQYLKYIDGTRIMDSRTKCTLEIYIWGNLILSCVCLYVIGLASTLIVSTNILCCALSALFVQKIHARNSNISQASRAETLAAPTQAGQVETNQPQVVESAEAQCVAQTQINRSPLAIELISTSPGLPHSAIQAPLQSDPS